MMEIGKCYIVTEVTSMVYVGRCVNNTIGPHTVMLEDATWVSETGEYLSTFLRNGRNEGMEIEPVGTRCIHWAGWGPWEHPLFKERA